MVTVEQNVGFELDMQIGSSEGETMKKKGVLLSFSATLFKEPFLLNGCKTCILLSG